MNKNIVILYYGNDWHRNLPMQKSRPTRESFEDWYIRAEKYGVKFYRASIQWYDMKKGVFTKAWTFEDGSWKKIDSPIKPMAIFDKIASKRNYEIHETKMEIVKRVPIINHPLFRIATDNKMSQYLLLQEYMPYSRFVSRRDEFTRAIEGVQSQKAVVKPFHGSGGFGIKIDTRENLLKGRYNYPLLVQEFIESNKGIPGFSKENEVSDLRMVYVNNTLIYSLSRRAAKDSLFTNFHQGATASLVQKNQIPDSAMQISKQITQKLSVFGHSNYSLDFMFDNSEKPFLVEMNTTPGFDLLNIVGDEDIKEHYLKEFLRAYNIET